MRIKKLALAIFLGVVLAYSNFYSVMALTREEYYRENEILLYNPEDLVANCNNSGYLGAGGTSTSDVPASFNLGNDAVQRPVNLMKALMADYQLSPEQAAGIVGNFMHESGGKDIPPDVNEGGIKGPPRFSGGYGWAQWTGSRQRSFIDFAIEHGYMGSDRANATDAADYAYLKHELNTGYQVTITEIKKATTPEDAAVSFEATFEKAGVPALGPRKANAREAFTNYTGGGGGGGGTSAGAASCGAPGAATVVGDKAFPLLGNKSVVKNPNIFLNGDTSLAGHPYTAYDILADPGTPIVAHISGVVTLVTSDRCPGRMLSIYNEQNDMTISYLHMTMTGHAQNGQQVAVGEQIGTVGPAQNGCGTPHLHIDAAKGRTRPGCSRLNCPAANKAQFVSIGPQLYETYNALPQ